MKKHLLFYLLCCSATLCALAQPMLTRREVYDFEVGDLFIMRSQYYYGPPTFETRSIVAKSMSTALDTLFCTMDITRYTMPECPGCPATYDTIVGQAWWWTSLDDTIGAHAGSPPQYLVTGCIDTTNFNGSWLERAYLDSTLCYRQTEWYRGLSNLHLEDSCLVPFEPTSEMAWYSPGLGQRGYYYNSCSQGGGTSCEFREQMVFYRKGNDSCGTRPTIPAAIQSAIQPIAITVAPNPVGQQAVVQFGEYLHGATVSLNNLLGENLLTEWVNGTEMILDGTMLDRGIYFLKVDADDRSGVLKLLRE